MKKAELVFSGILVPLDFFMLLAAGLAAYFLRISPWLAQYRPVLFHLNLPFKRYFTLLIVVSLFLLIIFALIGLYKIKAIRSLVSDFFKVVISVSAGLMVVVFYIFIQREWFNSRFILLAGWFLAIVFVVFGRWLVIRTQIYLMKYYHYGASRVVVIGQNGVSQRIIKYIKEQPALGYCLVGTLEAIDPETISQYLKSEELDGVILAELDYDQKDILSLIDFCSEHHLDFKFIPNLLETLTTNTTVELVGELPLLELRRTALGGWGRIIKRMIDLFGSLIGLVLLSPLFLLIALLIKWDSPGPVLVKLERVSHRQGFYLYKFRSMVKNAQALKKHLLAQNIRKDSPLFKLRNDPRITRFGRFLRRWRLDELPQLINVLKGEMSLVGPRPHQPDEIAQYKKHHKKVLSIKAGMTGLAQISGASDLPFEEEVRLDTYYIENWSLWLDLIILIKTFWVLFKKPSSY